jgi:large subunit ribosomal protein L6
MSRIGNAPITVPEKVEISVSKGNDVTVKGPKGELSHRFDPAIKIDFANGEATLERSTEQKRHKSLHGMYRSILNNMVIGVSSGFKKELELVGVGYRASNTGNLLELSLGYSHPIYFSIPEEVKVETKTEKGKNPLVILESTDNQLLGQVAAKIRSFRKPEPYKGKGVRYMGEYIRRKAGKAAAK